MRRNIAFFLLCFTTLLLKGFSSENRDIQYANGPHPYWVKPCSFSLEPVSDDTWEVNFQCLLIDVQTNWEEKSSYHHYVVKPLTHTGVSEVAEVEIDFDPTYEKVIVHEIKIFRDGEYVDRLLNARHDVLHRESQLESDLYEGELTLVYFLEDIAAGDILEYSYSLVGTIPYFSTHLAIDLALQALIPIDRFYCRLLIHPERLIHYKTFNTSLEPQIIDLSQSLCEWSWAMENLAPVFLEDNQPEWCENYAHVQLSEYRSWQEVIEKLHPLFRLPEDLLPNPPANMAALVKTWEDAVSSPEQRALLALRFVQEKVRYLGFEDGLNGFKPSDPRTVFQRRFGDCKDKTVLLCALLRLMNIDSTPVLVDTTSGRTLRDYLPSPFSFDHVILRIDIDGHSYWVDPTMNYQGGASLKDNFFPEYHCGLPLSAESTDLVILPENFMDKPTEIQTSFVLTSEDSAEMKVVWTFYGHKADSVRNYIASIGIKNMSDDALKGIQKLYGKGALLHPHSFTDDPEKNVITLTEGYRVPTQGRNGKKTLKVYSLVIKNYLESGINPERATPYALFYPIWVKEHIHIENPFNDWLDDEEESIYEHESLFFMNSSAIKGHSADLFFELKHLKDHVPVNSMNEYWEMTNEIEENQLNIITISKAKAA